MKQIFDWMREQIKEAEVDMTPYPFIFTEDALGIVDEVEAKFGKEIVSIEAYKQVAWERDTAIEQLHELGYEFGEKIREADCCEYKPRKAWKIGYCYKTGCGKDRWATLQNDSKYCEYCGKPIKISEVE